MWLNFGDDLHDMWIQKFLTEFLPLRVGAIMTIQCLAGYKLPWCMLYAQAAAAVSRRTKYFLQAEKPPKKLRLSRKIAEIYFSASRRKTFSLNLHYDEIILNNPSFTLLYRKVIKYLNQKN